MDRDAQDFVNCEACRNPAEYWYYCNACHRKLCQRNDCLNPHRGEGHNVVRFESRIRQNKQEELFYELCHIHPDRILNSFCKSCNQSVCDRCVLLKHRDMKQHVVIAVDEIIAERRQLVDKNTEILRHNVLPRYVQEIHELKEEISNLEGAYDVKRNIIQKVYQSWQDELKTIVDQILADLKYLEELHLKRLNVQQESLQKTLVQIEDFVEANEELLQSPSPLAVKEVRSIDDYLEFPEITKFSLPTFSVGTLPALRDALNRKKTIIYSPRYSLSKEELYGKSCIVMAELSGLKEEIQKGEKIPTGLKTELNLFTAIEADNHYKIDDICCPFIDAAWLCDRTAAKISKISESGKLIEENEMENLGYIAGQATDQIFYTSEDKKLLKLTKNVSQVVSNFEWVPFGLSVTMAKDILVCERIETRGRVVKYSSKGHQLKIIERCQGDPEHIFRMPERVIENSNGDVCVTDNCIPASLVVVNSLGKFQFRYTPDENETDSSTTWFFGRRESTPSSFNGLASDKFGNILISVKEKNFIHVLDKWGSFLKFLSSKQIMNPNALAIDNLQRLWIADGENQIKIVVYLNC
ncbi:uncharacterized protein LOC134257683 [Saccostrea cucullata]|uniref:uncharacterized protein LOC134257683 n=1 Tax=Saccostrea cuccullata TaxID=36930 RepID=UPI002ED2BA9C